MGDEYKQGVRDGLTVGMGLAEAGGFLVKYMAIFVHVCAKAAGSIEAGEETGRVWVAITEMVKEAGERFGTVH